MQQEDFENLPVVNQTVACRRSDDGRWSFDSMIDSLDKNLDLPGIASRFREDFLRALGVSAEQSEVKAFRAAYDLMSKKLGGSREMVFSAHVFIKSSGSGAGINIANNGTIYVLKVSMHTESVITKNPPRATAMPPTVDNSQLNWEPIDEDDVCLVLYNYSAARLMQIRQTEMACRIRQADGLLAASIMLDLEANDLPADKRIGQPNILLIPLR